MNRTYNKIALSFDVEDWYHTPVVSGYSFSKYTTVDTFFSDWKEPYDYLTEGFLKLIDLLEKKRISATFFIVADIVERYPLLVEHLRNSNHEIACHSLHHQIPFDPIKKIQLQHEDEWEEDLKKSKKILEQTFEQRIIGYRAPGAYFCNWMIDILKRNDFKYDSSIAFNSIYNKTNCKLKEIPTHPYLIEKATLGISRDTASLIEIPWSNLKVSNYFLPGGGAFFFRLLGLNYFKKVIEQNLVVGDTMFYMHPFEFTETKFPFHNYYKRPFYWINKGNKALKMLEFLLDKFPERWTTCSDVYSRFLNH